MSQPRKIRCSVSAVTDHGGHVYTVDMVPEIPVPLFRPGQFLHLTVDPYDPSSFWPESRVFSIASSPRERNRIRICYSVKGVYTTKMEQTLRAGATVWIKLPYGEFVIDDASDAVLIAGGTGISAFTAFLEALTAGHPRKVTLVYGARTPDLWLFRDMIERQLAASPSFSAILFAESGIPFVSSGLPLTSDIGPLSSSPRFLPGRISLDTVLMPVPSPGSSDLRPLSADLCPLTSVFYLSGPPVMLRTLGSELTVRGVPPHRIRTDAWE